MPRIQYHIAINFLELLNSHSYRITVIYHLCVIRTLQYYILAVITKTIVLTAVILLLLVQGGHCEVFLQVQNQSLW